MIINLSPTYDCPPRPARASGVPPRPVVCRSRTVRLALTISALTAAFGCGRPATEQDCERIVARVTELELQEARVEDPQAVESQIRSAQAAFRQRMNTDCVGRRLRPSSLECVEKATSAKQIVSECF